ncbi:MAG: YbaK/EbsC family protein [Thermomicrobiales bacterium]
MSERSRRAHDGILAQLGRIGADFSVFTHRPIRSYEDAELARQESGFSGTESKSMVLKSGDATFVYVMLAGRRVDFKAMRARIGGPKPKILTDEELIEKMGAEPGSAFPFGFGPEIPIYVDPESTLTSSRRNGS